MRIRPETLPVGALTCGLAAAAFAVGFLVLAFRLKMVQVDGAADATDGLRRQSIRRVQTEGVRGRILDCRGRVLADNRPSVSIVLNAGVFRQPGKTTEDGFDLVIGTNYIGAYYLTELLLPVLAALLF